MSDLEFKTEKRKLKSLVDCDYNPRQLSEKAYKHLESSFKKFGYVEVCVINTDNKIIAGHQRTRIMRDLGWEDKEIDVRVPNRKLNKKEFDEYLIRSNKNTGDWDYDVLANQFDVDNLLEWGFEEKELDLGEWESNLDDGPEEPPPEPEHEVIKVQVPLGTRTEIIPLIKEALEKFDISIL